ncbi:MAG: lysophospholipid acyltransferase family protein [Pirellulaceae bacterium]
MTDEQPYPLKTRLRIACQAVAGFTVMTVGSLVTLMVATLTLFQMRGFYADYLIAPTARIALQIAGVRFVVHDAERLRGGQVVFIANHASTLDVFILTAMRLPNTRFFLSGHLRRKFPPLGLLGYLAGVFWTVPQQFPERRVEIFKRAERVLRRTGESVFLSPEGNQGRMGLIAPFNKGAFHLATNLAAPIVPMYFAIPASIHPKWGYNFRPGVVDVYVQPPISTEAWTLEDLDANRQKMHAYYVELQGRYESDGLSHHE